MVTFKYPTFKFIRLGFEPNPTSDCTQSILKFIDEVWDFDLKTEEDSIEWAQTHQANSSQSTNFQESNQRVIDTTPFGVDVDLQVRHSLMNPLRPFHQMVVIAVKNVSFFHLLHHESYN